MPVLSTLLTAAGLGLGAGVNAYAAIVVFGLLARFVPGSVPGEYAHVFALTPVIAIAAVLYTIEFVADKIPGLDHAWDVIHSFIRPLAGAALGLATVTPQMPKSVLVLATAIAGGAALTSHVGKSVTRLASTATTGGLASPILSVGEDLFAIAQSLLAVFLPYLILVFVAAAAAILGLRAVDRFAGRRKSA
jgi:hypothetical protein